jgi:hypothetical protein
LTLFNTIAELELELAGIDSDERKIAYLKYERERSAHWAKVSEEHVSDVERRLLKISEGSPEKFVANVETQGKSEKETLERLRESCTERMLHAGQARNWADIQIEKLQTVLDGMNDEYVFQELRRLGILERGGNSWHRKKPTTQPTLLYLFDRFKDLGTLPINSVPSYVAKKCNEKINSMKTAQSRESIQEGSKEAERLTAIASRIHEKVSRS